MNINYSELDDENIEDIGYFDENGFQETPIPAYNLVKKEPIGNIKTQKQNSFQRQRFIPEPSKKQSISYDDILKSMNMYVKDGKLHLIDKNPVSQQQQYKPQIPHQNNKHIDNNMYNKYFNTQIPHKTEEKQYSAPPLTIQQKREIFLKKQFEIAQQRERISQIKSKKLLFSANNINIASNTPQQDLNKLFRFIGR